MVNFLKAFQGDDQSSAKVVDGKLILSFPNAVRPILWQMDFSQVKVSALEVLPANNDAAEGSFILSLKTPKGEMIEIAPFEKKEQAVCGLVAASKALESAHGKIRPFQTANEDNKSASPTEISPKKKRWWPTILLGALLLFVLYVWINIAPTPLPQEPLGSGSAQRSNSANSVGVPMSADDFLNSQ